MKLPLFAVVLIIAVAGCIGQDGNTGGQKKVESPDLIVTSKQSVVPSQPNADSDFVVRIAVNNQHKERVAKSVGVWIFDTGKCRLNKIGDTETSALQSYYAQSKIWPAFTFAGDKTGYEQYRTDFQSGQTEEIKLSLTAPGSQEIAGLPGSCPIRYKVDYKFTARSEMGFDVVSTDRLNQMEMEKGARPVKKENLFIGGGPIRVTLEPTSTLPVETGRKISYTLAVENKGTGEFSRIAQNGLIMKVPADFTIPVELGDGPCGDYFTKQGDVWKNSRQIDLVQKTSNDITCTFQAPASSTVPVQKQYVVSTELNYTYDYFGQEINVPVTP